MKCMCPQPGYCPRFDKQMVGRLYQICRDECDPPLPGDTERERSEKRLAYLELWAYQADHVEQGDYTSLGRLALRKTGILTALSRSRLVRKFRANRKLYHKWREAVRKWKAAGKPVRSEADQAEIIDVICPGCEFSRKENGKATGCKRCGCTLGDGTVFRGKVSMATEHCPIEKWPGEANYGKADDDVRAELQPPVV